MTLDEFLDRVPWGEMAVREDGAIRSVCGRCPIVAVWGGWNSTAYTVAEAHGLTSDDALLVMIAADNSCECVEYVTLRAEMLRRIEAARGRG